MNTAIVDRDIVYGKAGGRALRLDIYRPSGRNLRTAVVMLHGGAWARGSRDRLAPHAAALAAKGFTALTVEYRLTGEARFPAQIHDTRRALRWVRANAGALRIDPDRICIEGHSAGGHLALLAAGSVDDPRLDPPEGNGGLSARVAAAAAIYAPTGFHVGDKAQPGTVPAHVLPGAEISDAMAELASPIGYVNASLPPVMLLHGDADRVVPVTTSLRYAERVHASGGRIDLHILSGLPHGFANHDLMVPTIMTMIGDFFSRTVAEPERFQFGPSQFELAAQAAG